MTDSPLAGSSRLVGAFVRVLALAVAFGLGAVLFSGGEAPPTSVEAHTEHDTVWTCSMHPSVRASEPGSCPICGMDLIPATTTGANESRDRVVLSERARILARLQTTAVRRQGDAAAEVRLLGRVEPDETTRKSVTTWIGGRIDRLHVNTTGEVVRAGQVIATLYSPEVYAAHQDLLTAKSQVSKLSGGTDATQRAAASAFVAARERLKLLGVPDRDLDRMEQAERPTQSVSIRTPFGGTVIERVATEGAYVETGAALYRIANLDRLWVQLDAYESDLPRIAVGQQVSIVVEGLPEPVEGTVAFVDPTLDPQRRTARVRVAVENPDGQLRPGMFAEAVVASVAEAGSEAPLVIPASAALFTGKRSLVYVEVQSGEQLSYEPRTVRLGPRLGDVYPVVTGLSEGQRVVSRGAFAIDADLQIRGGASMMTAPDDREVAAAAGLQLPPEELKMLAPVVQRYLDVQRALAEDDHAAAVKGARALGDAVAGATLTGEAAAAWGEVADPLRSHAMHVAMSGDLEGARGGFEPLSAGIEELLIRFGNPLDAELHVAFCPMAQGDAGARWVQQGTTIDNAYFGASMRTCGEIRSEVSPGAFLPGGPPPAPRAAPAGHVH